MMVSMRPDSLKKLMLAQTYCVSWMVKQCSIQMVEIISVPKVIFLFLLLIGNKFPHMKIHLYNDF